MIPFSPPRIDEKTIAEVNDALRSGWITTGPRTKEFERRLSAYGGQKATLAVNSATIGLELALRWFGVQAGDEVIVPAYTYCATANVAIHCGAKLVMVDVRADDFCIDIDKVRAAITPRTKAIMPVDIGGLPCDYEALHALIEAPEIRKMFSPRTKEQTQLGRILLLADAAHSFGARYKGRPTGTLADISVFSFHAVKNLTTAEGGAMALNLPMPFDNEAIYKYLCTISLHGQSKDALAKTQKGGWRYDVIDCGYKGNMTDIQAAIGLVELERYNRETLPYRRRIFEQYTQAFKSEPWAVLPIFEDADRTSSFHLFCLRVKNCTEEQRDRIIQAIFDKDVAVNVHYQPLPLLTAFKSRGFEMADYPQAFANYLCEITLPVWYGLDETMTQTVIEAVKTSVKEILG